MRIDIPKIAFISFCTYRLLQIAVEIAVSPYIPGERGPRIAAIFIFVVLIGLTIHKARWSQVSVLVLSVVFGLASAFATCYTLKEFGIARSAPFLEFPLINAMVFLAFSGACLFRVWSEQGGLAGKTSREQG